jgi:hypothetical protein
LAAHLLYLSKHIKLNRLESLLGFYMISKVHKTLVMSYSIYDAYFLIISLVSLLTLRILTLIYGELKRVLFNTSLELFYCVCLSIDKVFSHTKKTHNYNTFATSYFYSRDFVVMYPNLNPV